MWTDREKRGGRFRRVAQPLCCYVVCGLIRARKNRPLAHSSLGFVAMAKRQDNEIGSSSRYVNSGDGWDGWMDGPGLHSWTGAGALSR